MRAVISLLIFVLGAVGNAGQWKSDLFHCTANLPDSAGWSVVAAPQIPGITVLVAMQNPINQSVFGINIVEKAPAIGIDAPQMRQILEATLRQFSYQFVGHARVNVGGIDWLQYNVQIGSDQQRLAGIVRFASTGGYVFGVTMLRGGGQDAAQDSEMQRAAASFRIVASNTAAVPALQATGAPKLASGATKPAGTAGESRPGPLPHGSADETHATDNSNLRMVWYSGAAILGLLILLKIIGGGKKPEKPSAKP